MSDLSTDTLLFGLIVVVVVMVAAAVAMGRWWRRRTFVVGFLVAVALDELGPVVTAAAVGAVVVVAFGWWLFGRGSFRRVVVRRVRASQRRCRYRQVWTKLMLGHGLGHERRDKTTVPRLRRRIRTGVWLDSLWVRPLVGQAVEDWERETEALAMALGVRECRVVIERPGLLRLDVIRGDPLAAIVAALPVGWRVDLAALPIGITETGGPWTVRLAGNHVLVAGVTGAGKSSVVWSMIRALAPLLAAGVVQLWGVDPKGGMELGAGRRLFTRFAGGDLDGMVELLEAAVDAMRDRADRYAGVRRTHQATRAEPLLVVVVDEMAFLTAYAGDNKLRDRANKALAVLLTQGRAVGVSVVAALQDPRKEVLGYRNLFPTKIALRLDERTQVDMILGEGARNAGARADRIADSTPGVGYVKVDGIREPQRVRAAHVTDSDIAELAGRFPAPVASVPEAGEAAA
ncbi:MAG: FtsK/SpoIIIE domain-containing protein [Acidimicrobiales bacterium]